ncbi:hypothetical protein ACHAQJ_008755 [Trichoderma viride]
MNDKVVIKVYQYQDELKNILDESPKQDEDVQISDSSPDWLKQSEYCRQLVKEHPDDFAELKEMWELRKNERPWHSFNRPSDKAAGRQALDKALQFVHVVCATPVTFAEMPRTMKWTPSMIIIDDAHLLTEGLTLLPLSIFPGVPALILGDVSQGGPVAKAAKDKTYKALFTAQREMSLIKRVADAGEIDFVLNSNYGADSGNGSAASTNLAGQNDTTPQTEMPGNSANLTGVTEQVERINLSDNVIQPASGQPDNDLTGSDGDQALMGKASNQIIP